MVECYIILQDRPMTWCHRAVVVYTANCLFLNSYAVYEGIKLQEAGICHGPDMR